MKDDPKTKPIRGIVGVEPNREGEVPPTAFIGWKDRDTQSEVTAIERREDHYGDHGIAWFDVYAGERLLKSFAARYVTEIYYADEGGEETA